MLHFLRVLFVTMSLAPSSLAEEVIIIENAAFDTFDLQSPIVAPVEIVRPITRVDPLTAVDLPNISLSKELLMDAAAQFDELRPMVAVIKAGPEGSQLSELAQVIAQSDYFQTGLYNLPESASPESFRFVESTSATDERFRYWDAKGLVYLIGTGVIDVHTVETRTVKGKEVEFVRFDKKYANALGDVFLKSYWLTNASPAEVEESFEDLKAQVQEYSSLQESLLERIGDITFGFPIVYTAQEKGLVVPSAIANNFDVFWIELAITFRQLLTNDLSEMVFNVGLPEDCIALELIPLRYGIDVQTTLDYRVPKLGIGARGAVIEVGEVFRKTIAFRTLRPTISGFGLQQSKFSWSLKDEATAQGSHRFVAVIGVPRGRQGLNVAMSGHARLEKSWLGDWFGGELVAGTDIVVMPVALR